MTREQIQIRDPFVFVEKDVYYLFGTTDRDPWNQGVGFQCYRSRDLVHFDGPYPAFTPPKDFWADRNFWAPEVHRYRGAYYMFASFFRKGMHRGTQILKADRVIGPYEPLTDKPYTPADWDCLDGTFYQKDGKIYSVFVHEWLQIKDGSMELVELSPDLTHAVTPPRTLFHGSDAPWVRPVNHQEGLFVTDGPFLWDMQDGRLAMLWSSGGEAGYALGVAYSAGSIEGPWIQEDRPLFTGDGGHGMIFRRMDGKLALAIHCPNQTPNERPRFFEVQEIAGKLRLA